MPRTQREIENFIIEHEKDCRRRHPEAWKNLPEGYYLNMYQKQQHERKPRLSDFGKTESVFSNRTE
jgi:hypothetical protein